MRTAGSDGVRTEAAIRRAAIDLIAARGFEAVTLRDIAHAVGLQAGSLYRYYESKNDLLSTLICDHMMDLFAQWELNKREEANATERLEAFIDFHVRYHSERPKEVFIANMELRSLASKDRKIIVGLRSQYEEILRQILVDGINEGEFSVPDVRIATFAILAMLTGLTAWYQEGGRLSKRELAACYCKLVMTGVRK